jgi:hypothetical protein
MSDSSHGKKSTMHRHWSIPARAFVLLMLADGLAMTGKPEAEAAQANTQTKSDRQPADVRKVGIWQPPAGLTQIPISELVSGGIKLRLRGFG